MIASWIWVLIPLAAIFAGVMNRWFHLKEREMERFTRHAEEAATRAAEQTDRLEQRVRVLERIVTDKGLDLSDQIERLRDDRVD